MTLRKSQIKEIKSLLQTVDYLKVKSSHLDAMCILSAILLSMRNVMTDFFVDPYCVYDSEYDRQFLIDVILDPVSNSDIISFYSNLDICAEILDDDTVMIGIDNIVKWINKQIG